MGILKGAAFEDVRVGEDSLLAGSLETAAVYFAGRFLPLEFELLRERPRELFDRLCAFLGIAPFPPSFEFAKPVVEDRAIHGAPTRASLCSVALASALAALRTHLAVAREYFRLARLLAA